MEENSLKKLILISILILTLTIFSFTQCSFADDDGEWKRIENGWFTGGNWSITLYNRSEIPLYLPLIVNVAELNGRQFDIEWETNATGEWTIFAYNLSCDNGTYQQIATWANQSNTTYWWMLRANSSVDFWNNSNIFNFTTGTYSWGPWSDWWVIQFVPKEINIRSFKPINFEDKGMAFDLSLDIIMSGYNGSLVLDISTREINSTIDPNNIGEKDGNYVIRDLRLPTIGNQNAYPFDKYKVKIEFITENDERLNTSDFETELHNIPQWEMQIQWGNNTLNATFSRTQEIYIFILLVIVGLISIVSNFIYIFKSQSNLVSFIGKITSLSFIVAGFIDFILIHPTFFSPYIIFLIILLFISIISSGFVYKQKKPEEK